VDQPEPSSAQLAPIKRDAGLGQQADHPTISGADGVAVEAVMVAEVFSKLSSLIGCDHGLFTTVIA